MMKLPDMEILERAQEMGKTPQVNWDFEPSPLFGMIEEQNKLLKKQNEQLESNNKDLAQLLELKEKELKEATDDAKKAKSYNLWMMIISIISMLVAVASWLLPNIFGG